MLDQHVTIDVSGNAKDRMTSLEQSEAAKKEKYEEMLTCLCFFLND